MSKVSVIVPFFNEAENIPRLYERLTEVDGMLADAEMEIVLVDDGSTDESVSVIRGLRTTGPPVRLVQLSRNFGSHAALAAGVVHATGDVMTFLSADLQDPPEIIHQMLEKWRAGFDIVWATRESRQDPWSTKVFARFYYTMLRRYALPQMPLGGVDLCMVDRQVVESLGNLQERNSSVFCLLMWAGFSQCFIPYHRGERKAGRSKWTMGKKIKLFIDSFLAFSFLPMRLISSVGMLVSVFGMLYALFIVIRQLFWGVAIPGWASLMVVVLLTSGVQLLMLGILSEYLWRTLDASRSRPTYIIRGVDDLASKGEFPSRARLRVGSARRED